MSRTLFVFVFPIPFFVTSCRLSCLDARMCWEKGGDGGGGFWTNGTNARHPTQPLNRAHNTHTYSTNKEVELYEETGVRLSMRMCGRDAFRISPPPAPICVFFFPLFFFLPLFHPVNLPSDWGVRWHWFLSCRSLVYVKWMWIGNCLFA